METQKSKVEIRENILHVMSVHFNWSFLSYLSWIYIFHFLCVLPFILLIQRIFGVYSATSSL